jgi:hypothetical protein
MKLLNIASLGGIKIKMVKSIISKKVEMLKVEVQTIYSTYIETKDSL